MTTSVQSKNSILLICTSVKGGRKRDIGDRAVLGVAKQETRPPPLPAFTSGRGYGSGPPLRQPAS